MIVWGVISAATAAVTNFGGLIAIRFFLGFVEAAYFPGCLYYLSCVSQLQGTLAFPVFSTTSASTSTV